MKQPIVTTENLNADHQLEAELWALGKIDVRAPLTTNASPTVRLELHHPARGRVTDVAIATGIMDAAFDAASQILGITPITRSYIAQSGPNGADGRLSADVTVELELDGAIWRGSSFGADVMRCSLEAWLRAAAKRERVGVAADSSFCRPFQVRGVDENDDVWIFASQDEGAAQAIAAEFKADGGYRDVETLPRTAS